ncbi:MAG TPA: PQQ-binding-like beta-propeller repeat protein [Kofleriaceae bacterium]|nr:PQQ-binding-like beta-propeller repeat protein [Kofleriaceae bacterium]
MQRLVTAAAVAAVSGAIAAAAGCDHNSWRRADAMRAGAVEPLGEDRLSLHWKFATADRLTEVEPQEFAGAAAYSGIVYTGSASGWFFALSSSTGAVRWRKQLGAVVSTPIVSGGVLLVGTADGTLLALDAQTGNEKWRYQSRGPIEQPPVPAGDLIVFANEADQVVAVDALNGKFKWQYKSETPEEYTLRGHAGVAIDNDLIYTGFANGILVALRKDTGSVAWSTSLRGEAERFMDVDATPLVVGDRVYASSSSGGVYALDKTTGLIRWRVPFWDVAQPSSTGNVGGMATDGKTLYVSVADLGTYAIDLAGNVVWRVGAKDGGEPAAPVVWNELLVYSLAHDGVFIADRRTGETLEYFDPGEGVSATPTVTPDGRMFVMSNRGILYAFDLE